MQSDGSAELDDTDTSAAISVTCIDECGSLDVDEDVMVHLSALVILRAERFKSTRDARLKGNTDGTAPSFSFFLSPGKDSKTGI